MDWVQVRWEKNTRYYEAHLHQDLWGDWILTQVWGQRGTRMGQTKHTLCASYQDGMEKLAQVRKRREQRGYQVVGKKADS